MWNMVIIDRELELQVAAIKCLHLLPPRTAPNGDKYCSACGETLKKASEGELVECAK